MKKIIVYMRTVLYDKMELQLQIFINRKLKKKMFYKNNFPK